MGCWCTALRCGRSAWTPASDRVVCRAQSGTDRAILAWQTPYGSGVLDTRHADERSSVWEGVVSPNGEWLLLRLGTGTGADLRYRRLSGDTTSQPLVATPASESDARFSPDGKWVAYASDVAPSVGRERFLREIQLAA